MIILRAHFFFSLSKWRSNLILDTIFIYITAQNFRGWKTTKRTVLHTNGHLWEALFRIEFFPVRCRSELCGDSGRVKRYLKTNWIVQCTPTFSWIAASHPPPQPHGPRRSQPPGRPYRQTTMLLLLSSVLAAKPNDPIKSQLMVVDTRKSLYADGHWDMRPIIFLADACAHGPRKLLERM